MNKFFTRLRLELFKGCFNVGFIELKNGFSDFSFRNVKWLDLHGYSNGWFADPFILEIRDDVIKVLVEEFEYKKKKGRLCIIEVSPDTYRLLKVTPILELETHLSYPSIYEIDKKIYICPENNEGGAVNAYLFENGKLVNPKPLIKEPLVDTQFFEYEGVFYAFGVKNIKGKMSETKEVRVFSSKDFFGPYNYQYTINNRMCEERGAGNIFKCNGKIYRPAQCCEGRYGKEVIIYELELVNGKFVETEKFRISGVLSKRWGIGIHQYHSLNNLSVIDGQDFCHWLARIPKRLQILLS